MESASILKLVIFVIILAFFQLLFLAIIISFAYNYNGELTFWEACVEYMKSDYFFHFLGASFLIALIITFFVWALGGTYFES